MPKFGILRYNILFILIGFMTSLGIWNLYSSKFFVQPATVSSADAFTRVLNSKILRCGYIEWPPYLVRDPNTNKLSGFTYDIANQMAENLGWHVEWVMPVLLGQEQSAMQSGGIDAICGAQVPINPRQAIFLDHSVPYVLIPAFAYVRKDAWQTRLSELNDPGITVATMDGDISPILRQSFFPATQEHALPNSADPQQLSLDVMYHKADVALLDAPSYINFNKVYPEKLRRIETHPLAIYPGVISIAKGESRLQKTISDTIAYMHDSGQLTKIFIEYKLLELGMIPTTNSY